MANFLDQVLVIVSLYERSEAGRKVGDSRPTNFTTTTSADPEWKLVGESRGWKDSTKEGFLR